MKETGSGEWWASLVSYLIFGLGFFGIVGLFGIDRFYRGQVGWGVVKLITLGGLGIWSLVDVFRYTYRFGKTGQWEKSPIEVGAGGGE